MAVVANELRSRRALLLGGIGGMAAALAGAIGRPGTVLADDGDALRLGARNTSSTKTRVDHGLDHGIAFEVRAGGNAAAIHGRAGVGDGVMGTSSERSGVYGTSGRGTGVFGVCETESGYPGEGVRGRGVKQSTGVWGESETGAGVYATSENGYGLFTSGRVNFFGISGIATIPPGAISVAITLAVNVTAGSMVLLSPRVSLGGRDLWWTKNVGSTGITIHLSSARSTETNVSWLLLN